MQRDLFWPHAGRDAAVRVARSTRHEPERSSFHARPSYLFRTEVANPFPLNLIKLERNLHQNVRNGADLNGRVPSVNVVGGVSFSHAQRLRSPDAIFKTFSRLN